MLKNICTYVHTYVGAICYTTAWEVDTRNVTNAWLWNKHPLPQITCMSFLSLEKEHLLKILRLAPKNGLPPIFLFVINEFDCTTYVCMYAVMTIPAHGSRYQGTVTCAAIIASTYSCVPVKTTAVALFSRIEDTIAAIPSVLYGG